MIEDEWLIAEYVGSLAEKAGATSVDFAESETDAIAVAKRHRPAIILSDVQLRSGTGPAAVETIQRDLGPIPVIFITGTPEHCHPCDPPAVVLGKPIVHDEVLAVFRRLAPAITAATSHSRLSTTSEQPAGSAPIPVIATAKPASLKRPFDERY